MTISPEIETEENRFMWKFVETLGFIGADELQALAALLGLIGAGVAFAVGLRQYKTAQKWKRKEFVASEMKEFFQDWRVRNALIMIDWRARDMSLTIPMYGSNPAPATERITRPRQIDALRPHNLRGGEVVSADEEGDCEPLFSPIEAQIRDTYDCLLDYFERFAGFVESGLVPVEELNPYLQYWIEDLAATTGSEEQLRWRLTLLAYIKFYRFHGTIALFEAFGYDLRVKGPIWETIKGKLPPGGLADLLELAIQSRGHSL